MNWCLFCLRNATSLLQIRLLDSSLNLNLVDYSLQGLGCHVTHVSHVVVFNCNIVLYNVALRHVNPVVSITIIISITSDVDLKWYSSSQSSTMPYQSMTTVLKLPHNTLSTFSGYLTFAFNICQLALTSLTDSDWSDLSLVTRQVDEIVGVT